MALKVSQKNNDVEQELLQKLSEMGITLELPEDLEDIDFNNIDSTEEKDKENKTKEEE